MSNVLKMLSRGGAAAAETDPNFKQTTLLLHGDGTNGAQNNTFLDGSTNNFTITRNGNTTQGTFSPFSAEPGKWGNFFNGSTGYFTIPNNAAFVFGSSDFTIEFYAYFLSSANEQYVYARTNNQGLGTVVGIAGGKYYGGVSTNGLSGISVTSSTNFVPHTWTHFAFTRSGTTIALWINGVLIGTNTVSGALNDPGTSVYLGIAFPGLATGFTNGYVSNLRVVKGRAVYDPSQSTISVPTAPLGATSGGQNPPQGTETSLLTCQSNRFVDNGGLVTKNTITPNSDVRVTPFSPFAPTAAYSAATNGGSGYFDGSGDWLLIPNNSSLALAGDFTIECWVWLNGSSGIYSKRANAASYPPIYISVANERITYSGSTTGSSWNINGGFTSGSIPVPFRAWNHIAVVRSGTTFTAYINGVADSGATFTGISGALFTNTSQAIIGAITVDGNSPANGYISNFRLVNSAVYTGNFTPPTAPLTAVSNTALLCNFTNAGIFDQTGKNNLETVGNAQIDTTVKKYGTGSLEFDGSDDRLVMPSNPEINLSSGNFTIEAWVYWTGSNANAKILSKDGVSGSSYAQYNLGMNGSGYIGASVGSGNGVAYIQSLTSNTLLPTNQWVHIAFVKNGTNLSIYQDGTSVASATQSGTMVDGGKPLLIGYETGQAASNYWNGYIDDFRITKGIARYTANFTPPTKEFPDL